MEGIWVVRWPSAGQWRDTIGFLLPLPLLRQLLLRLLPLRLLLRLLPLRLWLRLLPLRLRRLPLWLLPLRWLLRLLPLRRLLWLPLRRLTLLETTVRRLLSVGAGSGVSWQRRRRRDRKAPKQRGWLLGWPRADAASGIDAIEDFEEREPQLTTGAPAQVGLHGLRVLGAVGAQDTAEVAAVACSDDADERVVVRRPGRLALPPLEAGEEASRTAECGEPQVAGELGGAPQPMEGCV